MKKAFSILIVVFLVLMAIVVAGSFYLLDFALSPVRPADYAGEIAKMKDDSDDMRQWLDSLQARELLRDTFIVMPDGEKHHAFFASNPDARHGQTAILVHGHQRSSLFMFPYARVYYSKMHCNVVMPDLHAHGMSEGESITMAMREGRDLLSWIDMARNTFGDSVSIVMHGVSMGAASVMNASGEELPGNVKCVVEDCGYSSVWDEFKFQLDDMYSLPPFPLLYAAQWLCKVTKGYGFHENDPVDNVAKCSLPMLFIHGDKDTYVPFYMMQTLFDAKSEPKEKWVTHSAHAESYDDQPEEYFARVAAFVGKWINVE